MALASCYRQGYTTNMINIFKWDDSLATNFADVDLQHKKLILLIEDVHKSLEAPEDKYALCLAKDLKRLTDYTQYHFAEEEALMRKNKYPDIEAHSKEHASFIEQVQTQIKVLRFADSADGFRFYRFLGSWLISHIGKSDQAWAQYIREKNN